MGTSPNAGKVTRDSLVPVIPVAEAEQLIGTCCLCKRRVADWIFDRFAKRCAVLYEDWPRSIKYIITPSIFFSGIAWDFVHVRINKTINDCVSSHHESESNLNYRGSRVREVDLSSTLSQRVYKTAYKRDSPLDCGRFWEEQVSHYIPVSVLSISVLFPGPRELNTVRQRTRLYLYTC